MKEKVKRKDIKKSEDKTFIPRKKFNGIKF